MGTLNTAAMAEAVGEGLVALRPALTWHLTANHFPPVPTSMVDPCIAAIEAYVEAWFGGEEELADFDLSIDLPEGVFYKGNPTAPAVAIIDQYHLEFFVETQIYGNEGEQP